MEKHLKDFLTVYSIKDIRQLVIGELNEYSTSEASFWFGNGELIIATDSDEATYEVSNVRGFDELVSI